MWFKNLRLFCLTQEFDLSVEEFEAQLAENAFTPCSNYEKSRIGWVSPIDTAVSAGEEEGDESPPMFTHVIGDYIMICAQKQDRLLPATVVREATSEKVAEIEQRQSRKIYRKERREIQDDVYSTLLPRAFTRSARIHAYISIREKILVVNTATAPKAEEFLNLLRDTLGSFPVALPDSKREPGSVMTRWLKEQKATDKFEFHDDCELVNPKDQTNIVRCKSQDLTSDEIQSHLSAGKQVSQLGVLWNNILSCVIDTDLSVKRLRFDNMKEETESFEEESPAQKFNQEFALMSLEISAFLKSLFSAFGGLEDPKLKVLPDNRNKEE
ncbi:MAG: recombination-associated protein RdgC [Pseudomonadales bacterium]|nr:recombination-associated protein RdgC [Pseudomonadales bacterium]